MGFRFPLSKPFITEKSYFEFLVSMFQNISIGLPNVLVHLILSSLKPVVRSMIAVEHFSIAVNQSSLNCFNFIYFTRQNVFRQRKETEKTYNFSATDQCENTKYSSIRFFLYPISQVKTCESEKNKPGTRE